MGKHYVEVGQDTIKQKRMEKKEEIRTNFGRRRKDRRRSHRGAVLAPCTFQPEEVWKKKKKKRNKKGAKTHVLRSE